MLSLTGARNAPIPDDLPVVSELLLQACVAAAPLSAQIARAVRIKRN
jgi:hypothetical protein